MPSGTGHYQQSVSTENNREQREPSTDDRDSVMLVQWQRKLPSRTRSGLYWGPVPLRLF
jgi:hypothetical protein